jgi:hypothetical protein
MADDAERQQPQGAASPFSPEYISVLCGRKNAAPTSAVRQDKQRGRGRPRKSPDSAPPAWMFARDLLALHFYDKARNEGKSDADAKLSSEQAIALVWPKLRAGRGPIQRALTTRRKLLKEHGIVLCLKEDDPTFEPCAQFDVDMSNEMLREAGLPETATLEKMNAGRMLLGFDKPKKVRSCRKRMEFGRKR